MNILYELPPAFDIYNIIYHHIIYIYAYIFFNIFDFLRAYFYPIYNDNSHYPLKKNTVTEPEYIFSLYIYIFLIHTILKNIFVLLDIHLQYNYHVDYLVHQYHLDYQMGQRHEKN